MAAGPLGQVTPFSTENHDSSPGRSHSRPTLGRAGQVSSLGPCADELRAATLTTVDPTCLPLAEAPVAFLITSRREGCDQCQTPEPQDLSLHGLTATPTWDSQPPGTHSRAIRRFLSPTPRSPDSTAHPCGAWTLPTASWAFKLTELAGVCL